MEPKTRNTIILSAGVILLTAVMSSCFKRIDPGHVGIVVDL